MLKKLRRSMKQAKLTVDFWIIQRAVSRAAQRRLQSADGLFVDFML